MKKSILFSVACVLTLTSCATIVAGGNPKITIDGDTKDPVTIITEKQTYPLTSHFHTLCKLTDIK